MTRHFAAHDSWFFVLCRLGCLAVLRVFFGLRAVGVENIPRAGPLLVAANHQSYLDPPAIGMRLRGPRLFFIARAGLFRFKPLAAIFSRLNTIPIREDESDAAAIRETLRVLGHGAAVLIFPEGSRSETGEITDFKRGAALLVRKAKCPVLPVAIRGAYEAWPKQRRFPVPWRSRVRVAYGRPIPHEELMKDGPDAAMQRLRDEVVRLYQSLNEPRA